MMIELIRHGETGLQKEHRYQGTTDAPLSENGRAALHAADYTPDVLIVTPLIRTKETADIIFPDVRQQIIPELSEMNFGAFEGRNYIEMEHDFEYRAWVDGMCRGKCPGGESKKEFSDRVCNAFEKILEDCKDAGRVTIVAHGGTQRAVLEHFGLPQRDYFEWNFKSGQGCVLDTELWESRRKLTVLYTTDYTKG